MQLLQKNTDPLPWTFPHQSYTTTNLLSVSMVLPNLDISNKWNHGVCGLFCLASFTQHKVFIVHPSCHLHWHFIPFFFMI